MELQAFGIVGVESIDTPGVWEEGHQRDAIKVYDPLFLPMCSLKMYVHILNLHKCIHSGFPFFFLIPIKGNIFILFYLFFKMLIPVS